MSTLKNQLSLAFGTKGIDYLVNNGAIGLRIPSLETTAEEQFDELMNIHLKGTFILSARCISKGKEAGDKSLDQ